MHCAAPPPQKKICWSPNNQCLRLWSYGEIGSWQMQLMKLRSYRSRVDSLIWYDGCPCKKMVTEDRGDSKEECHVTTRADIGVIPLQAKERQRLLASHRTQGRISPTCFKRITTLPISWFWTESLQNWNNTSLLFKATWSAILFVLS